jgi:hypothetical protein
MGTVCYSEKNRRNESNKNNNVHKTEAEEENNPKGKSNNMNKQNEIKKYNKKQNNNDNKNNKKDAENQAQPQKEKNINDIYNDVLKQHNKIREKYKREQLKLNNDLTTLAQKYADNFDLLEESNFHFENDQNQYIGINYKLFDGDISEINKICKEWIDEGKGCEENNVIKYSSKTKHFTQIIWKNTKNIGLGYSELNNNKKIFIAFYYPVGNILNEFERNTNLKI